MVPVRCPHGHASETEDFCDECGAPIRRSAPPTPAAPVPAALPSVPTSGPQSGAAPAPASPPLAETCPWCGASRTGRFCEEDGYDFVAAGSVPRAQEPPPVPAEQPSPAPSPAPSPLPDTGATPAPGAAPDSAGPRSVTTWVVVVEADRRYYDSVVAREGPDIETVSFPNYYPREELELDGEEIRVGRRRAGAAGPGPHVDLAGPPLDPGVSHRHAVLLPHGTGGWAVLDPGSTNGTTINYADDPIPLDTPVPLSPGDRVHVGAFTTLTVHRR